MAPRPLKLLRSLSLTAIATIAAASLKAPLLFAQSTASIQVSATVVSVAPAQEAQLSAHAQAARFTVAAGAAQQTANQRISTPSRLAQVSTERTRARGGEGPDQHEAVWVTVEYAAN